MYIIPFFPLLLQYVMNIFAPVASYEYLIDDVNHFKPGELSLSRSNTNLTSSLERCQLRSNSKASL